MTILWKVTEKSQKKVKKKWGLMAGTGEKGDKEEGRTRPPPKVI